MAEWLFLARDHNQSRYVQIPFGERPEVITLLEKTPRNALNIRFLNALFPDARYIYLHRRAEQNIASIMEAWKIGFQTGQFSMYPNLPGWDRKTWCLILPPGWRKLKGKSIAEIAAFQWEVSNRTIMSHLSELDSSRRMILDYDQLIGEPQEAINRVNRFADVAHPSITLDSSSLPLSKTTVTPPNPEKWKKYEDSISRLLPGLEACQRQILDFR